MSKKKIMIINWGVVIIDICVMTMATGVSIWQNNPNYLWLLIIMGFSGKIGETIK